MLVQGGFLDLGDVVVEPYGDRFLTSSCQAAGICRDNSGAVLTMWTSANRAGRTRPAHARRTSPPVQETRGRERVAVLPHDPVQERRTSLGHAASASRRPGRSRLVPVNP
jgi:hypothetical protein